jgi:hypothetical protein
MNTPLRIGDRVEHAAKGKGTVEGFEFPEGKGEHVRVLWDYDPLIVSLHERVELVRQGFVHTREFGGIFRA